MREEDTWLLDEKTAWRPSTGISTPLHLRTGTQKRGACTWGAGIHTPPGLPFPAVQDLSLYGPLLQTSQSLQPHTVLLQVLPSGVFNVEIRRGSKPQQQGEGGVLEKPRGACSEEQVETTLGCGVAPTSGDRRALSQAIVVDLGGGEESAYSPSPCAWPTKAAFPEE